MTDTTNIENAFLDHRSRETTANIKKITDATKELAKESDNLRQELIKSRDQYQRAKNEHRELSAQGEALAQMNSQLQKEKAQLDLQLDQKNNLIKEQGLRLTKTQEDFSAQINTLTESHTQLETDKEYLSNELQESQNSDQSKTQIITSLKSKIKEEQESCANAISVQDELKNKICTLKSEIVNYRQTEKENHDLNLALLDSENQYLALKKQSENKISELEKRSSAVEKMRDMLAQFDKKPSTKIIEPALNNTPLVEASDIAKTYSTLNPEPSSSNLMAPATNDTFEAWLNPKGKTLAQTHDVII